MPLAGVIINENKEQLFDLMVIVIVVFFVKFNIPINNFSVMSGRSHRFLGINQYFRELMCLAQGHKTVTHVD